MNKLILVGAGGHAKSVIEIIDNAYDEFEIVGYVDGKEKADQYWSTFDYLGNDDDHKITNEAGYHISVGMIKNLTIRQRLFESFKLKGASFPVIDSKHAIISKHASISEGSIIMHHVIVNSGAKIGVNCILNNKCLIEHDAIVGNHCHISTGAIVNADCLIGNNVFIGSNVTVNRGIKIGDNVIIGSGSVVTRDIASNNSVMGVPAKIIEAIS